MSSSLDTESSDVGLGVGGIATAPRVESMEAGRVQCDKYLYQVDNHNNHRLPAWRHGVFFKFQYDCGDRHWRLREAMTSEAKLLDWNRWLLSARDTFKRRIRENLEAGEAPKTGDVDVAVAVMEFATANCLATVAQMLEMLKSAEQRARDEGAVQIPQAVSMTCESDGDIQRMLGMLRVEGLGAVGADADKPATGLIARAGRYMAGVDSWAKEKEKLEERVKDLEIWLSKSQQKARDAGVALAKAEMALRQLRRDVASEKKEKEQEAQEPAVKLENAVKGAQADVARERNDWHPHRNKEQQEAEENAYTASLARHKANADEERRKAAEKESAPETEKEKRDREAKQRREYFMLNG
jgi:hypothetical protein